MLSLPRRTHKYFLEPLTETRHIIKSLRSRFLRFLSNLVSGKKKAVRCVLELVKRDVRSTTGKNLRHLKLKTQNFNEKDIDVYETPYDPIPEEEEWRISLAQEIISAKCGELSLNLTNEEVDDLAEYVCEE